MMHEMASMPALQRKANGFGIKQKILAVLVGVLLLTTLFEAILASYYTNRQNEQAAFASLSNQLFSWQRALQATTQQLRGVALATVGDAVVLNQLTEIMMLESNVEDPFRAADNRELTRTLGYRKTVSLSRLHLALQTGGFSSIAVYTRGKLSHYVSPSAAGMTVTRANGSQVWVTAAADANGNLPLQTWPAWSEHPMPPLEGASVPAPLQPTVSFVFPEPQETIIEIAVPVQGFVDDSMTDAALHSVVRFFSQLRVAGMAENSSSGTLVNSLPGKPPQIFAVVVFRKLIDRTSLELLARETGNLPELLSPNGAHRQQLANLELIPRDLLAQAGLSTSSPRVLQRTVTAGQKSFYVALLPWQFENRTRLILGLAAARDITLQNVRQTVAAILLVAGVILLLSVTVGIWWVKRFMDPIVHLTSAVQKISFRDRLGGEVQRGERSAPPTLPAVDIRAPNEVGALTRAFNTMIARLARQEADLISSNARMAAILDNIPDLAWVKDIEGRYIAANQVLARTLGLADADDLIGKTDFDIWPSEIAEGYRRADTEVIASGERKRIEGLHLRGDGSTFSVETIKTALRDPEGRIIGTVGIARDATERIEAGREREARQVAEAANRAKSEFLANMSHELRTPLNSILGYAQILLRSRNLDPRYTKGLNVIHQSGEHLLMLINDILVSAKIEAGKQELSPNIFPLNHCLLAIIEIIRVKTEAKQLRLVCELAPDLPEVIRADERALRQVLLNLLANAVKFTDRGEVGLHVKFLLPARLYFEVRDTGIGIDEDHLKAIFQPFSQVGSAEQRLGGTGLGLAISRQFVRLMGSDIEVESRVGQGSVFTFAIEVQVVTGPAVSLPMDPITGYVGDRRRILVADDVVENRAVLREMLEPLGFEISEVGDGWETLEKVRSQRPDLILMDVFMPKMDGLEAIRRLRGRPDGAELPVITISASASGSDEEAALATGANGFLPKPIDQHKLLAQIGHLLGIDWIRASSDAGKSPLASGGPFVVPPPAEMQILHHLALQGSMRDIVQRAEHLCNLNELYRPFAEHLSSLAHQFQSGAILRFVERHLDSHESGGK